jgi:hypothetical protein
MMRCLGNPFRFGCTYVEPRGISEPDVTVGTGADPGFNASTTHQQNPNYRPFRQHLQSR